MSTSFRHSGYDRNENDAYYTEPWVTWALINVASERLKRLTRVWEPACGPGYMAYPLLTSGLKVYCSDLDDHPMFDVCEHPGFIGVEPEMDFLKQDRPPIPRCDGIITNPPFGATDSKESLAEKFVYRALSMEDVSFVAMLLRSEFNAAGRTRPVLFQDPKYHFAYEIVLTSRPRWDWWMTEDEKRARRIAAGKDPDKKESGPMHCYSWYVWDRQWKGRRTQFFQGRDQVGTLVAETAP